MSFEDKSRRHSVGRKDNSFVHGSKKVEMHSENNLRPQIFPVTAVCPVWRNIRIDI